MTLRVVSLAVSFIAGIVLATVYGVEIHLAVLCVGSGVGFCFSLYLYLLERRWKEWSRLVVILTAAQLALPIGYWRTMQKLGVPPPGSLRHVLKASPRGVPLSLRGTICREPELRSRREGDVHLRVEEVRLGDSRGWRPVIPGKVLIRVYLLKRSGPEFLETMDRLMDPRAYGYRLEVETRTRDTDNVLNPCEFDYGAFLLRNDVVARYRCYISRLKVVERSRGNILTEMALAAKRRFLVTFKHTIRSPASRLVAAATLGTRRAVENTPYRGMEIVETFRHAGVGHVLAVSGLHVSVICVLLYGLFRLAGMRPRTFVPALIVFLVLFALLTGARPSSVRAVIMNSVILITFAYFRCNLRQATYSGLALSSLLILLHRPMVLYAPGFLLSYGAVLSLVLIAPTVDRWLRRLRGFSLLFAFLWFVLLIVLCAIDLGIFLSAHNCLGLAGLLWLAVHYGARLNDRFPFFWTVGLEPVPEALRMFFSAQLAIQVGMMIPLSAWFFGQFPLAGVLVNLIAIPAIGVLVQLGMLTGLVGLIPWVGDSLALPFGAAASVVGHFFFWLAHAAAARFPFPSMPKPTVAWMIIYYVTVAAILSAESWKPWMQGLVYRYGPRLRNRPFLRRAAIAPLAALLILPLFNLVPRPERAERLTCLASGRYPLITIASRRNTVLSINAGDEYVGSRLLFESVRRQGAASLHTSIICGPQPRVGNEGLAALALKMPVRNCHLPILVDDPDSYLDAIGDDYLVERALLGQPWALEYVTAYKQLLDRLSGPATAIQALRPGRVVQWQNLHIAVLPAPDLPHRFVSRVRTALLEIDFAGFRWLILTDSTLAAVTRAVPDGAPPYDVLVLPDLSSRTTYLGLVDTTLTRARPRVVIVCGRSRSRKFDVEAWARQHSDFMLLTAVRDGAVYAELNDDGSMQLRSFVTGKSITLAVRP